MTKEFVTRLNERRVMYDGTRTEETEIKECRVL